MAGEPARPLFHDVPPARRVEGDRLDAYTAAGTGDRRRPALVIVHGGPVPPDARPRDWPGFVGYASLAAARGLVGVVVEHRLHSDQHYPTAAGDVAAAVERVRALDGVDPDRIGLWFFSGAGPLAVDWMVAAPPWLRAVAWNYPVLAPPPDWDGDIPRFDAIAAVSAAPDLPLVLLRVGREYPPLVPDQDRFVAEARRVGAALDVVDIPDADHGFEGLDHPDHARTAVDRAMDLLTARLRDAPA